MMVSSFHHFIILAYQMVRRYTKYAAGSGIPQLLLPLNSQIRDIHLVNHLLQFKDSLNQDFIQYFFVLGGGAMEEKALPFRFLHPSSKRSMTDCRNGIHVFPEEYARHRCRCGVGCRIQYTIGRCCICHWGNWTQIHFNYFRSALLAGVIIAGLRLYKSLTYLYSLDAQA